VAYLVTDILSDRIARLPTFGEQSALELTRPAAVKTGTTTDLRDNWTVGYTPDLLVGVWVGNADNEPMRHVTGVSGAAPIWRDVMEAALKGQPAHQFSRPDGLVETEVCALSGLLPGPDCPHRVKEMFLEGTVPTETCTLHRRIAADRATGMPAASDTPQDRLVWRAVTVLPPQAQAWAEENGLFELGYQAAGAVRPSGTAESLTQKSGLQPPAPLQNRLVMGGPDAGASYRLDPALPREAQRIEVSVWAEGKVALGEVTLLVDGRPLARFSAAPYKTTWQLEPGLHRFAAEGVGQNGSLVRSDEVRVDVHW
jgi:membrane carboxypeptidase/penicillin-binding protein PbpC